MKKTKIICTIGPASSDKKVFAELVESGLNVARLNFSHGSHEEQLGKVNMIKEVRAELNKPVALLLDTKGPEIRTGLFKEDIVNLKEGQFFTFTSEECKGDQNRCCLSYKGLINDVVIGDSILIDDGLIGLEVVEFEGKDIKCKVLNDGPVKDYKGVNVPGVSINLPAITDKDKADIIFGIENGIDFIAASFIRKASDVLEIRKVLEDNNAHDIHIISKIENQEGVNNIDEIIEVSDGIMVARGDLGVEIPLEQVPIAQKMMIRKCNAQGKPVVTATQMLDSMIRNPRPTRAETTDVANAIFDGTDAIMLSGETAMGSYPVESVKTMVSIAKSAEEAIDYQTLLKEKVAGIPETGVTFAVSHATCTTALDLKATAILTATASGFTARKISKLRPKSVIVAATPHEAVRRKLALIWGVESVLIKEVTSTDEIFDLTIEKAKENKYIKHGDLVVITAGVPVGVAGATNLMKVQLIGDILVKGTGLGKQVITGNVCIVKNVKDGEEKFKPGDIIVTNATDKELMKYVENAAGLIVEEGGYTSHAAVVAVSLGIPAIVGAKNATSTIKDGALITLDSEKGIVYAGRTRVL
ncbi:MAG: pyruvate kinase [Bacillota bacterium]|nr:pyruvate kinase [Bacillota bacterium]